MPKIRMKELRPAVLQCMTPSDPRAKELIKRGTIDVWKKWKVSRD
jgi:hypothetical protein